MKNPQVPSWFVWIPSLKNRVFTKSKWERPWTQLLMNWEVDLYKM